MFKTYPDIGVNILERREGNDKQAKWLRGFDLEIK